MKTASIKIQYLDDSIPRLTYVGGKSDQIDLAAAETVTLKAGEFRLIHLGVAMKFPEGYEAHLAPRSSTFKNFGILQVNSVGVETQATAVQTTGGKCPCMQPAM